MGDGKEENIEEELTPRDYQSLLLEKCIENNTILYLPTGSGKTYIAVMLIKHMSGDLGGDVEDGGKRTFFMVNTVALVMQQAQYIRRHTPLSVGHFSGDMNVDFWTKEVWLEHLNKYQVVVMTTQIFLDLLHHRYIKLKHVNLLIFDECHHGVSNRKKGQTHKPQSDHSMAQVMQLFNDCPVGEQPRVLGMTATILNSDCKPEEVKEQVEKLERTYRSKISTVDEESLIRRGFCTNPDEGCYQFRDPPSSKVAEDVEGHIKQITEWIMSARLEEEIEDPSVPRNAFPLTDLLKINKKLKNIMEEVKYHVNDLGLYGGSISALKHIIQLERLKAKAEDQKEMLVLLSMITTLSLVRKMMEDEMSKYDEKSRIYKYSSPKVLKLIGILKKLKPEKDGKVPRGIIFVERRFTAKVISMILKYLNKYDEDFDFLKADFIVGFQNNPYKCTREGPMEKKWNTEALYRFNHGYTNIIASSDVLEEGIDIPSCNVVVKFDVPKSYRSYIQSKGRARFKPSTYSILVPSSTYEKFMKKYYTYHEMEQSLKEILASRKDNDVNVEESLERKYSHLEYCVHSGDGISKVTMLSAIALVNRYCTSLPQDIFTVLAPCFYLKNVPPNVQCILKLPMNSPVKDTIEGDPMPNKRLAKQSVALETCKRLHKAGELDDHLLPVGTRVDDIEDEELFLHWENEQVDKDHPRPGTKKHRRSHRKEVPSFLYQCVPQANAPVYLHVLNMKPTYQRPPQDDSRKLAFYELIRANEGFAILSSKKLPEICDFPIFLNVGSLNVSLLSNYMELTLTDAEITKLRRFNTMIFYDVLKLCRSFMTVDFENKENSYFIVPTKLDPEGNHCIDWNVVYSHTEIPAITKPSDGHQENILAVIEDYFLSVVAPWYRSSSDQMYVVTQICRDMTPLTPFPSREYVSFEDYYRSKYSLKVKCQDQPLIEVKSISNRLNCLRPRSGKLGQSTSKRKRQEMQEDFEEHFIPELCFRFSFPSVLWLKATTLPSVLHRVSYLLIAEELRLKIAKDLGFDGQKDVRWEPLRVDQLCLEVPESSSSVAITPLVNTVLSSKRLGEAVPSASLEYEPLPWDDEDEPVDIDRKFMEEITLVDVLYYDDFINKPVGKIGSRPDVANISPRHSPSRALSVDLHVSAPIRILDVTLSSNGPEQYEILQSLTAASSADIINMERLETLGDSFLKFSVSLFLFLNYPHVNEGKLTELKGKMVGNRNLFYCARARGLNNIMKVQDFAPRNDWIPPGFCVPRKLQCVLREANLCPNLLYEVQLPREDQLKGELSPNTKRKLEAQLLEWEHDNTLSSSAEFYIGNHIVSDKSVADCVEAVLGAYLKGYGVEGAAKLLGWFEIIPPTTADVCKLLKSPANTAFIDAKTNKLEDVYFHLPYLEIEKLETALNYHFKDHSYLLQALTHASYIQNRVTDCYQRLEFLGDAILDFLITCHIYETCGNLTPGELTDLRSSLVNNITFGCLAVRNKFHQYCKYESVRLFDKIDTFVRFQESQNHVVNEKVLILLEEEDCQMAESIDVPKVLGDLFESLAGAVFLDSGKSLKEVWRVFYRLMKREIDEFSKCVPKQPVRMLHEACNTITFQKAHEIPDTNTVMVELELMLGDEKKRYYGFGENKANAKRAAAKLALKDLL
ncbi:endoribonuclease Dcr-2 [Anabrus simplex]|uniref:endoribonuclease Dcr-2 n=1 Tax=Anabrus simplex TaxID=316456 RepID=UPI0035A2B677